MSARLSDEQQQMILDNRALVHYLAKKYGFNPYSTEYDDIISIGTIGLIKAANTFDESKKITFATYASKCIQNEIFMYCRQLKKYAREISLESLITRDESGNELTVQDKVEDLKANFIKEMLDKESVIQLMSVILNYLKPTYKLVMLYKLGNMKQKSIAKILNLSQSYVSRVEKKAIKEIQKVINQKIHYKEIFSIKITKETYQVFKTSNDKKRLIIQVPAQQESFVLIAQIIQEQEIEDSSIMSVCDKKDDKVLKKAKADKVDKVSIMEESKTNSIMENYVVTSSHVSYTNSIVEGDSQLKEVIDYILSIDSFTVKELKQHFSKLSYGMVNGAIYIAKAEGLIKSITKDQYVLNKN